MATTEQLTYEEVLEYLADRESEEVTLSSYPTTSWGDGGKTLLGLSIAAELGAIKPVELAFADFVKGQAAVRIEVLGYDGVDIDNGLVLTREWFGGAELTDRASRLDIIVRADPSAEPLHPPVGQEPDPDQKREVGLHELVGWGFAFDFDGSPPLEGRWADGGEKADG